MAVIPPVYILLYLLTWMFSPYYDGVIFPDLTLAPECQAQFSGVSNMRPNRNTLGRRFPKSFTVHRGDAPNKEVCMPILSDRCSVLPDLIDAHQTTQR